MNKNCSLIRMARFSPLRYDFKKSTIVRNYNRLMFIMKHLRIECFFANSLLFIASKTKVLDSSFHRLTADFSNITGKKWHVDSLKLAGSGILLFFLVSSKKDRAVGRSPLDQMANNRLLKANKFKEGLLNNMNLPSSVKSLVPRTLFSFSRKKYCTWVEEHIDGLPLNPIKVNQPWFFDSLDFLSAINKTTKSCNQNKRQLIDNMILNKASNFVLNAERNGFLTRATNGLYEMLNDANLQFSFAHGDFCHNNLVIDKSNKLKGVIDWDCCFPEHVLGYDIAYFLIILRVTRLKKQLKEFKFNYNELGSFLSKEEEEAVKACFARFQITLSHKYWSVLQDLFWFHMQ